MGVVDNFKRDLVKHRGRAAVLGVLFVAMVAMSVRAVLELRPRNAAAAPVITAAPDINMTPLELNGDVANVQARIRDSQALWQQLRHVEPGATDAQSAFTFDAAHFPAPAPLIDPNKNTGPAVVAVKPTPAAEPAVEDSTAKTSRIREQARALIVKSTAVGKGTTEPMAIVNQQLVTVGQKILGFEVTAIRSREVEFVKEGVTVVGKMPEGQ